MPRDFTAVKRDELLRRDRDEHAGRSWPPCEDASAGDWTMQLLKARRVLEDPDATDEQRETAGDWLRAHNGTSQAPTTWEG